MHWKEKQPWPRRMLWLGVVLGVILISIGLSMQRPNWEREAAAQQLATQPAPTSSAVSTLPALTSPVPSSIRPTPTSPPTIPSVRTPASVGFQLPIKGFSWPAAGIRVAVIGMAAAEWRPQSVSGGVDPDLSASGFDPVGHWLIGTGQTADYQAPIIAAHTCYQGDYLCNDTTFPFNRLSYEGWATGQAASVTDATGTTVPLVLTNRQVVSKHKQLPITQNRCDIQVFSCNVKDPGGLITIVTFQRTQCTP